MVRVMILPWCNERLCEQWINEKLSTVLEMNDQTKTLLLLYGVLVLI